MISKITYSDAIDFLLPRHYSGRKPVISYSFGWVEGGNLVAVCTFGKPASNSLCKGVCGDHMSTKVYELNRLCTNGNMKANLSEFVGKCLRQLKPLNLILVSYADKKMNHNGYIYQATNWLYTGATKSRTDKFAGYGKHSRHYDKDAIEQYRQVRSSKHRYVIFVGSKTFKRHCELELKYKQEQYPKGANKNYVLGDYIKPEIYKVRSNV